MIYKFLVLQLIINRLRGWFQQDVALKPSLYSYTILVTESYQETGHYW